MQRFSLEARVALVAVMAGLVGCQAPVAFTPPPMVLDQTPEGLYTPQVQDWASQRISSPRLKERRDAHYKTLAYPTAATNWTVGATAGLPLSNFGIAAGDFVPNGPAAAFQEAPASPLYNKLFYLTRGGKLIKVDRATPTSYTVWSAPAGKTFSRTYVTMSPRGSRAYLLADDGTMYVVNTVAMTTGATIPTAGASYGIAPWIDPYTSRLDDLADVVYVATNTGTVNKYTVSAAATGAVSGVSAATSYNVAGGTTPMFSLTRRVQTSPVVLGGVIYLGDTGGYFRVYDTNNTANNLNFPLGSPVMSTPAIEIQDGSYAMTDPSGAPKTVNGGAAVYAFVNAGASCAWINLHDQTITRSQPLRIDDNDSTRQFGYLLDYTYAGGGTTEYLAAVDGGNINTEAPDRNLPGYAAIRSNDYLVPAETNTYAVGGAARGGPVYSYIRWQSATTPTAGQVVSSAILSLTPTNLLQACRIPEVRATTPYYFGTTTPWASNALTNSNRPVISLSNVSTYLTGAPNGAGNVWYSSLINHTWDVAANFATPAGDGRYALALRYNAGGSAVFWPDGPVAGGSGLFAGNSATPEAPKFRNNALNADPSAGTATDDRPLLTLTISNARMPSSTIETPPVIDAYAKQVYVFYMNTLFAIDFSSPQDFSDTVPGEKHTLFNLAYHGVVGNNATGVGGTRPGAAYNNRTRFVGNYTAPVPASTLNAMYVLNRAPATDGAAPTSWNYAFSKISLPLSATANRLVANSPRVTGLAGLAALTGTGTESEASSFMVVDPFPGALNVYYGLSNGRVYQYQP